MNEESKIVTDEEKRAILNAHLPRFKRIVNDPEWQDDFYGKHGSEKLEAFLRSITGKTYSEKIALINLEIARTKKKLEYYDSHEPVFQGADIELEAFIYLLNKEYQETHLLLENEKNDMQDYYQDDIAEINSMIKNFRGDPEEKHWIEKRLQHIESERLALLNRTPDVDGNLPRLLLTRDNIIDDVLIEIDQARDYIEQYRSSKDGSIQGKDKNTPSSQDMTEFEDIRMKKESELEKLFPVGQWCNIKVGLEKEYGFQKCNDNDQSFLYSFSGKRGNIGKIQKALCKAMKSEFFSDKGDVDYKYARNVIESCIATRSNDGRLYPLTNTRQDINPKYHFS